MADVLYIVVPCYNEEAVLPLTTERLREKLSALIEAGSVAPQSRVLYVDDGARDKTWTLIEQQSETDPLFEGVKLAHNRGHQSALLCGLMWARERCDIAVSMDADLQDDVDALDEFLREYAQGHDIVFGVRSSRAVDSAFKRITGEGFYKVMAAMGVETVYNHAEYRLMSRRALDALSEYGEINLFLRSIVAQLGFSTATVPYERHERAAGETKYPLKKMIAFAIDGITSFSVKPLRLIGWLGALILFISVIALIVSLCVGAALIVPSIWAIGGIQLLCLCVVGEYVGKIYAEVKRRPRYFIEKHTEDA